MTRVTNLGRKRTHVEATFNYNEADLVDADAESSRVGATDQSAAVVTDTEGVEIIGDGSGADGQPPKKKRKRGPRKKAGAKVAAGAGHDGGGGGGGGSGGGEKGEGEGKNSSDSLVQRGKKKKAKPRTPLGSPLLATSPHSPEFIPAPFRTQRSFGRATSKANSRAKH